VTVLRQPQMIDCDPARFDEVCRLLAEAVNRRYQPDLVVGIATGGAHVAERMRPFFAHEPSMTNIRIRRAGTAVKGKLKASSTLPLLPRPVANGLRWLEVEAREAAYRAKNADVTMSARETEDLDRLAPAARRVLIVDDMVDSGRTLEAAAAAVRARNSSCTVTTAVIASSWRKPPVQPDICLYDRTLVRFPWSMDATR